MAPISLHFFHTLNDFLMPRWRGRAIICPLNRKASVKDVIESFNVPHTEVDIILVNGVSVGFDCIVQTGDVIAVYPIGTDLDVNPLYHLCPQPPNTEFVIDANLGRLARYLRLLGFDCLYENCYTDQEIAEIARDQQRIVLTRDRLLLQRKIISFGYFVREDQPKQQVREVLQRFHLIDQVKPLTRCSHCNGLLIETPKEKIIHRLEPLTKKFYNRFLKCLDCDQIYWQGSHCQHVRQLIDVWKL